MRDSVIPSDFCTDLSRLDYDDNYGLALRKRFDESFANSSVAAASVFCRGFLDVILSPRFPTVDWEKGAFHFWSDGNQPDGAGALPSV